MGTRILVLGYFTLGLVLPPFYIAVGAYWLYSAWQLMTGRDAHARKVEEYLNRRRP